MRYENSTAIEMLLDAWRDEQDGSMRKYLEPKTRGDLINSIWFQYSWDKSEYVVHIYPSGRDDYYVEIPVYDECGWPKLIETIEEIWYSEPEDNETFLGKYTFTKA